MTQTERSEINFSFASLLRNAPILKKVLYISYDGMTDPLGQSQVIPYLLGLAAKGHSITVLSCEKRENYPKLKAHNEERFAAAGIDWQYVFYSKRPPVFSTFYDLMRMASKAREIAKAKDIEVVHCRTILSTLIGASLKKKLGTKLVFDIRGFWADERVEGDLWNLDNPLYKRMYNYFKRKESEYFSLADHIITLTDTAKNWIEAQDWPGGPVPPIRAIPCAVNLEHFSQASTNEAAVIANAKQLGIGPDDFVLTYLGSLGTRYMLRDMMTFFKVLHEEIPNARFLFITRDNHDHIRALAAELGIPNDALLVIPSTYNDIPNLLALAHASIFFIKTGFSGKAVSPTKQAELLSMGIPIVCNNGIGDCDAILEGNNVGVVLHELNEARYREAAQQLKKLSVKPKADIRQVALDYFSLEAAVENYNKVYEAI